MLTEILLFPDGLIEFAFTDPKTLKTVVFRLKDDQILDEFSLPEEDNHAS